MKYVVELNGQRHTVSVEPDGVRYAEESGVRAELSDIEVSPVRMVKLGTHVYRVVAERRQGRGRYTLWVDGYRFEAEALDERTRAIRDPAANAIDGPPRSSRRCRPGRARQRGVGDRVEADRDR
jgi:hypothetical protein